MAVETLFVQKTHEAQFASTKETPLLPVCCLADSFETRPELTLIVRAGSRSGHIKKHMASIRPIAILLTPTVRGVSPRRWRQLEEPK